MIEVSGLSKRFGAVQALSDVTFKVEKGQTLISIARKAGVDRQVLIDENKLKAPYNVRIGQTLKLPGKRVYTVQSGDTLYSVARRFGTPAAEIAEFNDFTLSKNIRAGQKLRLPDDAVDALKKAPPKKEPAKKEPAKPAAKSAAPKPEPAKPAASRPEPVRTPAPEVSAFAEAGFRGAGQSSIGARPKVVIVGHSPCPSTRESMP